MLLLSVVLVGSVAFAAGSIFDDFDKEGKKPLFCSSKQIPNLAEFLKEIGWEDAINKLERANKWDQEPDVLVRFLPPGTSPVDSDKHGILIDAFGRRRVTRFHMGKEFEEELIFGKLSKTIITRNGDVMTVIKQLVDGPKITHEILLFDKIKTYNSTSASSDSTQQGGETTRPPERRYFMNVTSTCNNVTIRTQLRDLKSYYQNL